MIAALVKQIRSGNTRIALEVYGDLSFCRVLLLCHGFPGTNRLPGLKERLPRGITLVEVNYRGDKKSGGVFGFQKAIEDVINAARYLKKEFNPNQICALGYSAGGLYALNAARRFPDLFSSLILLNPLVNTYFLAYAPVMKKLWAYARKKKIIRVSTPRVYEREVRHLHRANNPVVFATAVTFPVTLVQSDSDEVIPIFDAKTFFDLLKTRKQYISLPGSMHDCAGDEPGILQVVRQLKGES